MSLNGSLQVGRSAIVASQAGMQVTGNNMANAATEGYHRRSVHLSPMRGEMTSTGHLVGRGVSLLEIRREIDAALQGRFRDAISREEGAGLEARFLESLETLQNELTDNDVSSLLSTFFNSFSELANNPEDSAVRLVVVEEGRTLADRLVRLRGEYGQVLDEIDRTLADSVDQANALLDRIADINQQIARTEPGVGQANALRDQRDLLIDELASYVDVSVVEQASGVADVFVGSIPVVLAGESRGLELRIRTVEDELDVSIRVAADGTTLDVASGRLGAALRQREGQVDPAVTALDDFAGQLVFQVNRLHAQGQGRHGQSTVTGAYAVADTTANLNNVATKLPFRVENGSFFLHVTHAETGTRTTHRVDVDGDAMSLDDLVNQINVVLGVPNVTAGTGPVSELVLDAAPGYELSFSDDSTGILAALGMNGFFTGSSAADIAVRDELSADPGLLSAGTGHVRGSNGTALGIAALQDEGLGDLGGLSLREFWQRSVGDLAVQTAAAQDSLDAARLVRDSLGAQLEAATGVSIDEEAINLLTFQRQFQAAARYIAAIDETLQTLLTIA
ncbi:MAG: flagellar hook-associated protein FlgK [Planctomycetota bacterium]|jgi:flagellar hook-associated protein 1 FlgK